MQTIKNFLKQLLSYINCGFLSGIFLYIIFMILLFQLGNIFLLTQLSESMSSLDYNVLQYLAQHRTPELTSIMKIITFFGSSKFIFAISIFILSMFFYYKKPRYFLIFSTTIAGSVLTAFALKEIVGRTRPEMFEAIPEFGASFPSWHALGSLVFYGIIMHFLYKHLNKKAHKILTIIIGSFMILAIGFSRLYLGVHWPSDVIGGYFLGAAWLSVLYLQNNVKCG